MTQAPNPDVHDYWEEYQEMAKRMQLENALTQPQFYTNFPDCRPRKGSKVYDKYHD